MQPSDGLNRLIEKMKYVLTTGFHLGPDVLSFMESTYAITREQVCQNFTDVMKTMDDPDLLVELIVYPDENIQLRFEPVVRSLTNCLPEENQILDRIEEAQVAATIILPDKAGNIQIAVSRQILERFINRLNLGRHIPPSLTAAIHLSPSSGRRDRISVKLRNSRFAFTHTRTDFLIRFFSHFPEDDPSFFEALDFMLEFLTEIKNDTDIGEALIVKRKVLNHHIQKAEDLSDYLSKTNVETFLLSGNRVCGIHIPSARRQIAFIRSILYHVMNVFDGLLEDEADMKVETYGKY